MTPFQEFRLWARRAPSSERALAGVAAAIVLALLAWLLVPGTAADDSDEFVSAGATVDDSDGDGVDDDLGDEGSFDVEGEETDDEAVLSDEVDGGGPDEGTGGGGEPVEQADDPSGGEPQPGEEQTAGQEGCTSPPGSAQGVTDSEVKIAITLVNIAGPAANSLFGIPSVDDQRANWEAVVAATNEEGGVACRKVAPKYYVANPVDRNELQQTCLAIAQAGLYAVLDTGAWAAFPEKKCFPQQKIPYFGGYFLKAKEANQFYPYLFNLNMLDTLHRHTAFGLKERGFFDPGKGFKKLGFLYQSCNPEMVDKMKGHLGQAGASDIVSYDLGCPSSFASPSDLQQAVLKFQQNGVSHVTFIDSVGDFTNFTNIAEQQRFRPKYGVPDEGLISISYGSQRPNPNNIDGAIAITSARNGEETTKGTQPSPGTAKCNAIFQGAGRPSAYKQPTAAGNSCNQMWMFKAAMDNAPSVESNALAAGLQKAKSLEFSFPQGPNDFSGDRVTTGGQFWRSAQFSKGCECWQVPDPKFRPGF